MRRNLSKSIVTAVPANGTNQVISLTLTDSATTAGASSWRVLYQSIAYNFTATIGIGDTAAVVAGAVRAAINSAANTRDLFSAGGTGANITVATKTPASNDPNFNLSSLADVYPPTSPATTITQGSADE
jgi:phage tail sheath gpL-like